MIVQNIKSFSLCNIIHVYNLINIEKFIYEIILFK